ncbi:transcriptional regulator, TetR family [Paenibacillus algorifonticola]|uniref:Transcriptional regulator, TetR family n=1 Tax=Paenibacillus algorifonticola TaxID=684063 RepID=A0A1I2F6G2_9BACL|nr:TetR/AcrR family transcriptional regulator [Paenibacillus algorifonticola]SFF00100.1 transcriptional regulator, TetR family [Paenibacillus algorifonticola]
MATEKQLDRRTRRTRQAIKAAFVSLILERGYEAVTILDVAKRADYNRGTFYKHFVGKEELLQEIRSEFLLGFAETLLVPYEGMDLVKAEDIYPSALQLFNHIEKHKDEFQALLSVDRSFGFELYDVLRESMRRDMHIIMDEGSPALDYEILLSYQMSAAMGVILYWEESGFKYSTSYMADQLIGLVNRKMDKITFKKIGLCQFQP